MNETPTNKEVSQRLQKAFLRSDPQKVARLCANFLMDINRYHCLHQLDDEEKARFMNRVRSNLSVLYGFILDKDKDGDSVDFIEQSEEGEA